MSGLTVKQVNKVRAYYQSGFGVRDICALTGFEAQAVRDSVMTPEEKRAAASQAKLAELTSLRNARPVDRSVEEHERVLRGNFPELYEVEPC